MMDLSQYKTTSERIAIAHSVSPMQWNIVEDWSDEASDKKDKETLHRIAVLLYHKNEGEDI